MGVLLSSHLFTRLTRNGPRKFSVNTEVPIHRARKKLRRGERQDKDSAAEVFFFSLVCIPANLDQLCGLSLTLKLKTPHSALLLPGTGPEDARV